MQSAYHIELAPWMYFAGNFVPYYIGGRIFMFLVPGYAPLIADAITAAMTLTLATGPIRTPYGEISPLTNSQTTVGKASAWGGMVGGYVASVGAQPMLSIFQGRR